jgi:RNA polymerase sigma factor
MDPGDEELSRYDMEQSKEIHLAAKKQEFLGQVVEDYIEVLGQYGVTLDDLVKVSPKHKDSKENLMKIALTLASQSNLMEYLTRNRLLPVKELELLTGVKRKVIEKSRRYLIALALIITDPRFYPLKSFTRLPEITREEKVTLK